MYDKLKKREGQSNHEEPADGRAGRRQTNNEEKTRILVTRQESVLANPQEMYLMVQSLSHRHEKNRKKQPVVESFLLPTCPSVVFSIFALTTLAEVLLLSCTSFAVMIGVLMFWKTTQRKKTKTEEGDTQIESNGRGVGDGLAGRVPHESRAVVQLHIDGHRHSGVASRCINALFNIELGQKHRQATDGVASRCINALFNIKLRVKTITPPPPQPPRWPLRRPQLTTPHNRQQRKQRQQPQRRQPHFPHLGGVDDLLQAGDPEGNVHARDAGEVERLEGHLRTRLGDALRADSPHRLDRYTDNNRLLSVSVQT